MRLQSHPVAAPTTVSAGLACAPLGVRPAHAALPCCVCYVLLLSGAPRRRRSLMLCLMHSYRCIPARPPLSSQPAAGQVCGVQPTLPGGAAGAAAGRAGCAVLPAAALLLFVGVVVGWGEGMWGSFRRSCWGAC